MKRSVLIGLAVALLAAVSAMAQGRPGSSDSGDRGGNSSISSRGSSGSTAPAATTTSRDYSSSTSTVHQSSMSRDYSAISGGGGSGSSGYYAPDLSRTSFASQSLYFQSMEYFWWLRNYYGVNPSYFGRFYRNTEPLLTPQIAKLTLRQPLELSTRMLSAVDDLEALLRAREAGQDINIDDISSKTNEIRNLARQIRQNQTVDFFDQRKSPDILKGLKLNSVEAVSHLRELVTSLNSQLRDLYEDNKPFAVSVGSLTQPSFESLSKGIEKLSKSIESSARKI